MIQFITVCALYSIGSNLADYQFLYIDLVILIPLSMTMGYTGPYKKLTSYLPAGSLLSFPVLSSVLGQVIIQAFFQIVALVLLQSQFSFYAGP